jgi:hypothetical protein
MATLSGIITPTNVLTAENTATLTNKTIQAANLTGATQFAGSSGTTGQVLTSAGIGAAPNWADAAGGNFQEFTTSGTWTKPAGAKFVMVEAWGAGGGGGSGYLRGSAANTGGGGGGGGSYATEMFLASALPATVTVAVGAGGTGGAARTGASEVPGLNGSTGGTSQFGTGNVSFLVSGNGGGAGAGGSSVNGNGGGGGGVFGGGGIGSGGSPQLTDPVTPFASTLFQPFGGGNFIATGALVGFSGFGGGAGSGGSATGQSGGDSFKGGGGGGGSFGTNAVGSGGVTSRSRTSRASGGSAFSPNGSNGVFGNGGGGGRFSEMGLGTSVLSVANVGSVVLAITSQVGYYRTPTPTGTPVGYQLPSGITQALSFYNLTSSSTEFVIARGTSCFSSTDGISWTQRAGLPFSVDGIKFVNGIYFLYSGAQFATSTDLDTWTNRTSEINASGVNINDVAWNGTVYVVVASDRTYTSSNLSTWTPVAIAGVGTIFTVAASTSGRIVAICSTAPRVQYSDNNGATWTGVFATTAAGENSNRGLIFANGRFVFGTYQAVFFSTDGINWTTGTASARAYQGRMIFTSSLFVSAGTSAGTTVSSNGSSWSDQVQSPATFFPGGAGGAGGISGGGGGGASAQVNSSSGAGGNGGNGLVRVYFW